MAVHTADKSPAPGSGFNQHPLIGHQGGLPPQFQRQGMGCRMTNVKAKITNFKPQFPSQPIESHTGRQNERMQKPANPASTWLTDHSNLSVRDQNVKLL